MHEEPLLGVLTSGLEFVYSLPTSAIEETGGFPRNSELSVAELLIQPSVRGPVLSR